MPKYFALHLDTEIMHYFTRMYEWLSNITCEIWVFLVCFDIETMKLLEARAPSASEIDRQLIIEAYQERRIFAKVTGAQRRSEKQRRKKETTEKKPRKRRKQKNMQYLGVAAQIIWDHLLPHIHRSQAGKRRNRDPKDWIGPPLSHYLYQCWDETTSPEIEVSEGEYHPALGPPSFDLAYQQLVLAALRQFPHLSNRDRPRIDHGYEILPSVDPACLSLFYRRAHLLGFRNQIIEKRSCMLAEPFAQGDVGQLEDKAKPNQIGRRLGLTYSGTYHQIQAVSFLPNYADYPLTSSKISALFIQRDLLHAHLGDCRYELDLSKSLISVNLSSPRRQETGKANTRHRARLETIDEERTEKESDAEMEISQLPSPEDFQMTGTTSAVEIQT